MPKKVNQMLDPRLSTFMPGGKVIVDLGCGAGEVLDELSQLYEEVIGLDVNTTRLDQCNAPPARWSFVCADLNQRFPLESDYADGVFANQVIEHIEDPYLFARETFRILKPGGMAVITTPNIRYIKHLWRLVGLGRGPSTGGGVVIDGAWDNGHIHYFTHRDLREVFNGACFSYIQSQAFIELAHNNLLRSALNKYSKSKLVRELLSGNILLLAKK